MCENFNEIWRKRLSPKEADQTALFLCVTQLVKRAKNMSFIVNAEKESTLHDFYLYKLLPYTERVAEDKAITPSYIVSMMNNYIIDLWRKPANKIEFIAIDTHEFFYFEGDYEQYISQTTRNHCAYFMDELNECMKRVMAHFFAREKKYLSNIKAPRYNAIKLGIKRKKGQCLADYHHTTLIGQWLVKTYGKDVLPFKKDFLHDIFQCLAAITFTYIEAGYFDNIENN